MLKRTCAALLAVMMLALCSLPVFAASHQDYDYSIFTPESKAYSIGGYVSDEAIEAFNQYSNDVEQQFGINLVFVITNDLDGEVEEFSDYLFLNAPLGQAYNDNIILLAVDMTGRRVDLYTHGTGMQAITDRNTDYILDNVAVPALKSQDYENLPASFASTAEQFIQQWQDSSAQPEPSGNSPSPAPVLPSPKPNTSIPKEPSKYDRANSFLTISLLVSTLLTGVLLVVNISKHRPVKAASNANVYMNSGSFRLTENTDRFIRTYTTRVAIPKNDPPSSSSSSSSFSSSSSSSSSSSHSHSSGHSHGGGSRGF